MLGTLLGGLEAARAMRKYQSELSSEERRLRQRRDRLVNEDPTGRADARHLLNRLDSGLRRRLDRADRIASVTGGSPDASAVERNAATETMATATASITADARRRADSADADYEERRADLRRQRRQLLLQRAGNTVDAGAQFDSALLSGLMML